MMKPSYKAVLIEDEGGLPYAIYAPADFTAEHERELSDLNWMMGIDPESCEGLFSFSMKADRVQRVANHLAVFEQAYRWNSVPPERGKISRRKKSNALCMRLSRDGNEGRTYGEHWRPSEETELSVAYSPSGFEIMAYSDRAKEFVRSLEGAIASCDLACFRGGGSNNAFERGGLVIAIPSKVPEHIKTTMLERDADRKRLRDAALATGIEARIRKRNGEPHANLYQAFSEYRFHALKPAWASTIRDRGPDRGGPVVTEHEVIFFLNPGSKNAQFGWYTVEELDQWIDGKGPVLKELETVGKLRP